MPTLKPVYALAMARPRSFDEDAVVDRAMEVFWERGFERTSVPDLVDATGVHPGSLYRVFGDKQALFATALGRYRDTRAAGIAEALKPDGPVMPRIRTILLGVLEDARTAPVARGCLAVNTACESGPDDQRAIELVRDLFAYIETTLTEALERADARGELKPGVQPEAAARLLSSLTQGLQVLAKVDRDPGRLADAIDLALVGIFDQRPADQPDCAR